MTEPEIRRFCQQAEVETLAGCEAARRTMDAAKRGRRMVESGNNHNIN